MIGFDQKRVEYILDAGHDGEKVEYSRCENVLTKNPEHAVDLIALHNAGNRRSHDKTMHLVVSFPEGEKPRRESR